MHICVRSEDDRTDYSVHNPTFQCAAHHPHSKYEFFTLSDRIEPHVQMRLFFNRHELADLRDRLTAALNVGQTDAAYVHDIQPENSCQPLVSA